MRTTRATRALGALTLGLALTLSACGNDDDVTGDTNAATSTTEHNDADVAFATDMIQHHAQALAMVDMTMNRTLDSEVRALAEDIRAAQAPEIETMSDWLQNWGEDVPETMRDHANAHNNGDLGGMEHGDMPGMMTEEDMTSLEGARDAQFQAMWLEMMIRHHEGAIEMAEAEQEDGRYKPATDLARDIVASQSNEIETMRKLLSS